MTIAAISWLTVQPRDDAAIARLTVSKNKYLKETIEDVERADW